MHGEQIVDDAAEIEEPLPIDEAALFAGAAACRAGPR